MLIFIPPLRKLSKNSLVVQLRIHAKLQKSFERKESLSFIKNTSSIKQYKKGGQNYSFNCSQRRISCCWKKHLVTIKIPNMSSNISLFLNDESLSKYYTQWLSFKCQKPQQVLTKFLQKFISAWKEKMKTALGISTANFK